MGCSEIENIRRHDTECGSHVFYHTEQDKWWIPQCSDEEGECGDCSSEEEELEDPEDREYWAAKWWAWLPISVRGIHDFVWILPARMHLYLQGSLGTKNHTQLQRPREAQILEI